MAREINLYSVAEKNQRYVRGTNRVFEVLAVTPYKHGIKEEELPNLKEDDATTTRLTLKVVDADITYKSFCPYNGPEKRPAAFKNQPTIGQFWVNKMGSLAPSTWKVGTQFTAKAIKIDGQNIHFDTRS